MKPICPSCGYVFDHDATKGQLYRCAKCREFFNVGEGFEKIIRPNENVEATKTCADLKDTPKGETRFIPCTPTHTREKLPGTSYIATNIEAQDKMQTTESRKNKESVFRQMVCEWSEIVQSIKDYFDASKRGRYHSLFRARVPIVVRIYGTIFMVLSTIGMILSILLGGLCCVTHVKAKAMVGGGAFPFIFFFVLFMVGKGLKKGQSISVYAMCIFAVLSIIIMRTVLWYSTINIWMFYYCLITASAWGIIYLPPIFSAFSHWDAFSKSVYIGVPIVVRIYGTIIMMVNAVGLVFSILGSLLWVLRALIDRDWATAFWGIILGTFCFGFFFIMCRIGKGLKKGQRRAVYAMCLLAAPGLIFLIVTLIVEVIDEISGSTFNVSTFYSFLSIASIWGLIYLPPIISAFRHWDAFTKGSKIG